MFRTRFKLNIVTEFLPPARTGKTQKAIILCDGMPSIPRKQPLAEFLAAKGHWVFYPRYRGAWESGGEVLAGRRRFLFRLILGLRRWWRIVRWWIGGFFLGSRRRRLRILVTPLTFGRRLGRGIGCRIGIGRS